MTKVLITLATIAVIAGVAISVALPLYAHSSGSHWHKGHGVSGFCPPTCLELTFNHDAMSDWYQPEWANAFLGWWDTNVPRWTYTTNATRDLTVESGNYGSGWLGAHFPTWVPGGVNFHFASSLLRFNDFYLGPGAQYDSDAWRTYTVCHELGHHLGLDHFVDSLITTACLNTFNMPNPTLPGAHDRNDVLLVYQEGAIQGPAQQ